MDRRLIIHHWDTDGICSASILLSNLRRNAETAAPIIGNYFLTDDEIEKYSVYDRIYVVDMALPENNIEQLSARAEVEIFDHHVQSPLKNVRHINPVAYGSRQEDYPSATWVLKEHFNEEISLLVILGIIGDNEHKIKNNRRFYDIVRKFCREHNVELDDIIRAVHLIDSNYKLGKREEVERLPHLIGSMTLEDMLSNEKWKANFKTLEREIERIINSKEMMDEREGITVVDMDVPYNIISTVTRRLAWNGDRDVIVINRGYFEDSDQIYVRSSKKDLGSLIDRIKKLGYNVGGKKTVMGVIVPKEYTEDVIESITKYLGGKKW